MTLLAGRKPRDGSRFREMRKWKMLMKGEENGRVSGAKTERPGEEGGQKKRGESAPKQGGTLPKFAL